MAGQSAVGQISIVDALEFENYIKVVPNYVPELIAPPTEIHTQTVVPDKELLLEVKVAFELLQMDQYDEALKNLRAILASRVEWCDCAPGICEKQDQWSCREKSPLVKKPHKPRKPRKPKDG